MPRPKKTNTESQMTMKKAADILPVAMDVNLLYSSFIGKTTIEEVSEEDFVIKSLYQGKTKNWIVETLKKKHPEHKFNYDDLEKFMARNRSIVEAMGKEVTLSARRHLKARVDIEENLAGLSLYVQDMVLRMKEEGDHTNEVAAVRALNTTLENYMKISGMIGPAEGGKVINIINTLSDKKGGLRDRVHNANFVEVDEDGKVQ